MDEDNTPKIVVAIIVATLLIIFAFCVIFGSFYTIGAGERGILTTFGNPDMTPRSEGLHFKIPIAQQIVKMDIKTLKYEAQATAASKDLQIVTATIATNYRLTPESTPELYKTLGVDYANKIISPLEQEVVKATTARFTAEELITKREEVRQEIRTLFTEKLRLRGIIVEEVSIVNFDFSPSFNAAIEAKVTAEQLKLKADRDLERIKVEAEQKITQANAEATALRAQKQAITAELLQLRAIEKWDGHLPMATGGVMPFIEVKPKTTTV